MIGKPRRGEKVAHLNAEGFGEQREMTRAEIMLTAFETRERGMVNSDGLSDGGQAQAKFSATRCNALAQFDERHTVASGFVHRFRCGHPVAP